MSHYKSNVRDIDFNLFEVLDFDSILEDEQFSEFDRDTVRHILSELERLATEDMAASFVDADRNPPKLVDGNVGLPASLKRSLDAFYDGGWDMLGVPQDLGGLGAPAMLRWAGQEMLVGANPTAYFFIIGGLMAVVIGRVGTPEQAEFWAKRMLEKRWGGTMVLTEPDAGSDVGAGTTKAIPVDEENGIYHIEGVKRFITSGASDYHENIIHLVLARRPGAVAGTKGLSLFIVPDYLVNDDGSLGERNGVAVTKIEDKMGIKSSTTCELTFGAEAPAVGYLVGGNHQGIKQMFHVIEDARMLIGTKSMSTLSTAYLNALEYAKERIQSADMTEMTDKEAPRVAIIRHPDVRRMLMLQKAHAEGMRALVYYTAWALDKERVDPEERYWAHLSDLLLPMLKGFSSEKSYELLAQSLQVFGGSGYLREYPMEQYIRDVKIDSLYEGTTGIQALDLFFRKIARDQGKTLGKLAGEIVELVKGGSEVFEPERQLLGKALEDAQAMVGILVGHAMAFMHEPKEIYKTGLHTNALLESLSEVVIAWLLLRHAEIADRAMPEADAKDKEFYEGKIESARFFIRHIAPKVAARLQSAQLEDAHLMEMSDGAF
jgi:alkylation response protein AidB-like acyl-CoA dehydrogenase